MSRKRKDSHDDIRGRQFKPMFYETFNSAAYRQLSLGAKALLMALRMSHVKNNGSIYLSSRDAAEMMGHKSRNDIANWYRELEHYGFIVKTKGASLGVDGKGKAAHWRLTELPTRKDNNELELPTLDFLRWDGAVFERHVRPSRRWNADKQATIKQQTPGRHVESTLDGTSSPVLGGTSSPPEPGTGTNVPSISAESGGTNVTSISKLAISVSPKATPEDTDEGDTAEQPGGTWIIDDTGEAIWLPDETMTASEQASLQ